MNVVAWIAIGFAALTCAGGMLLVSIFRQGSESDQRAGIVIAVVFLLLTTIPVVGRWLLQHQHRTPGSVLVISSLVLSLLLLLALPAAISAAGQP